jgi:protein required for attachment to host cells
MRELFQPPHVLPLSMKPSASNKDGEETMMVDVNVPRKSWVVVCDGAKALIMQNDGGAALMNLQVKETLTQPNEPDRAIGSDKPGRTHAADGQSGSAMEETDWHEQAEADFLKRVAAKLDSLVQQKEARHIVLIAPPKALGALRPNLSADAQAAIAAEVAKDYTNMPVEEIQRHLAV